MPNTLYAFNYLLLTILGSEHICSQFIDVETEVQTSFLFAKVTQLKRARFRIHTQNSLASKPMLS